ncbi:hypothetical protein SKA53_12488 [Yoonia vestfoldensis SKA53]|uniref:Uncharacterized protein n=1 Tax=Yoonia vestfoldensis SKA53 TaxID=314232 RepID=A3V2S2_9RHOB|nr:hypothetical protein SKA53_12488 [Yoonia vestfoldensis SKA53]
MLSPPLLLPHKAASRGALQGNLPVWWHLFRAGSVAFFQKDCCNPAPFWRTKSGQMLHPAQ